MKYLFTTIIKKTLSDIHTPVELYLKLRDKFPNSFLLESSDYKSKENSYSYICLQPIASFVATRETTTIVYPDGNTNSFLTNQINIADVLQDFSQSFQSSELNLGFASNGLFG